MDLKILSQILNSQFFRLNCHLSVMEKFEWCVMGHLKFLCDVNIARLKYNTLISDFQLDS
jgi:hypothetical protein